MVAWRRWLKYAKARVDAAVRSGEAELDEREAQLRADQAGKPWLASDRDTPTFDEAKARIDDRAAASGRPPPEASGDPAFDLAQQQRAAEQRLADMRESLGLDDDPNSRQ